MRRFSIAELIGVVAVLAIGLTMFRAGTELSIRISYTLALSVLTVALLGTFLRPRHRGAWLGFAVFGWIYFIVALEPFSGENVPHTSENLLTSDILRYFAEALPRPDPPPGFGPDDFDDMMSSQDAKIRGFAIAGMTRGVHSVKIGHALLSLVFGYIGSILGPILAALDGTERRGEPPSS